MSLAVTELHVLESAPLLDAPASPALRLNVTNPTCAQGGSRHRIEVRATGAAFLAFVGIAAVLICHRRLVA
ncbi:hypothetical protein [Streptomyces lydicus]|uniref:Uncharacterized protein n=1 Tax=Streptomyces lydicus TaxID=47763 RepID=A0A1D7VNB6_9ACTN|nr:hypothetical protein [Streptomyces lydicus]AOP47998.1 hypothetical protein SL103_18755 [Streptomyces lydicus]